MKNKEREEFNNWFSMLKQQADERTKVKMIHEKDDKWLNKWLMLRGKRSKMGSLSCPNCEEGTGRCICNEQY